MRCSHAIDVARSATEVTWSCEGCGDAGTVTHFAGSDADFSAHVVHGDAVVWCIDDAEHALLLAATAGLPELRAIVARACVDAEFLSALRIDATADELDSIYTLVEHLTDATRSRRRLDVLEGLRASLSTAIDGF